MASVKQYLSTGSIVAILAATLPAPAAAQYHQLRSDRPLVEIDLGALSDGNETPATRPAWQTAPQSGMDANPPPVVLHQPLPPPGAAAAAALETTPPAAAPETPSPARPAVRQLLKPIVPPPAAPPPPVAEAPPVLPLAEPVPAEAPPPAPPAASMASVPKTSAVPAAVKPERKPVVLRPATTEATSRTARMAPAPEERNSAALQKQALTAAMPAAAASGSSDAPLKATMPRSDLRHFARPVLPDEAAAPPSAPQRPAPQTAAAPVPSLAKPPALPQKPLSADSLPARKPPLLELPPTILNEDELAALTSKAPPAAAVPLPTPKPTDNLLPPLTEPELLQISRNVETVPVRVAVAPQRLQPQSLAVPTLADLTLEFDGTSSELNESTRQRLLNILPHLAENASRRLAVHAYASGEDGSKSSARRISLSRALAVRAFLMDNGVPPTRVDVRALGLETDRKPLERVDLVFAR